MDEIWEQFARIRQAGGRAAMATLIATRGTTPKKEGAKMWVGEGGHVLGSVTIGGCVDARVIAESEAVLVSGEARRIEIALGDEEAWDLGLTCSGVVEVLVEPVGVTDGTDAGGADTVATAYATAHEEVRAGRAAVVVRRLDGDAGRMVVRSDGSRGGTLGSERLDRAAADRALDLLARRTSRTALVTAGDVAVEAFFEVLAPAAALVVFGATSVAMPLVSLARTLGYHTVVVDARPRFATRERFPDAAEIRVGIPSEIAAELSLGPAAAVVLLAHDYKFDIPVLREVLRCGVGYVGLLGSTRRGRAILDFLAEQGVPEADRARIHVPVGLDIGADSAAEIALSVLAEAVAVRNGRPGGPMRERSRP